MFYVKLAILILHRLFQVECQGQVSYKHHSEYNVSFQEALASKGRRLVRARVDIL